ncbi:zinc ribbon domain-containing protein [Haloparvum alkalitolerans]|uniref:zinc ribbon domain-containing protein n=1 Tax=Haloparvum alkalitolerans TaxID=1042953 RepID=UPI003CFA6B63
MSDVRVRAFGAYSPRLRIDAESFREAWGHFEAAGVETKAVPEADEDALTMGVEAARRALDAAGVDADEVEYLSFATTTPPMAESDLTARLTSLLGVPTTATTLTMTGSTRAGAQALDAALDAGPWGDGVGLVVAADCPTGAPDSAVEHAAGAAGVAAVVGGDGPGVVRDRASHVEPFPGTRFRGAGSDETTELGVTSYDRKSFETAIRGAVDGLGPVGDVDAAAVQSPNGKLPYRVTGALGVDAERVAAADTVGTLGDTGAASALLGAAKAFDDGADRVLLAAYGSGAGANAMVLDGDVPTRCALDGDVDLSYPEYLRRRGEITADEPDGGGAYVSVPSWKRTIPQRHRLIAGRCPSCDALNFPPEGACRECHDRPDDYKTVRLPGTGTVEGVTTIAQGGAPPEFVEQQSKSGPFVSAVVALDGPAGDETVSVPTQVLAPGESAVEIGDRTEAVTRRIYRQEGVIRYGFKMRPVETDG